MMAIRPTRGSGIGQVAGSPILPQNPSISEQLSRIAGGQQPLPMQQGLGIDLSPVPGMSIPQSEVALPTPINPSAAGMPDETSGLDIFGQQPTAIPFTQGLLDLFRSGAAARGEDVQLGSVTELGREAARLAEAAEAEAAAQEANAAAIAQREAGELKERVEAERAGKPIEIGFEQKATSEDDPGENAGIDRGFPDGESDPVKAATMTALDEYLKSARPGVKPEGYEQYIKEFQDATGLDVSGQPDKSTALMAFGLALMQNKAGSGFDVGEMLSAVGSAGEKALPELTAAKKEARAIRAKAGEYALGRKKEDQAAAMNRSGYYILPAGASGSPQAFIDAVTNNRGRHERLNAYELNALDKNEEFNKQYDIIPAERYEAVVQEVIKASNKGKDVKSWLETPKKVALFGSDADAPEWAKVDVFYRNPNSDERGPNMLAEDGNAVMRRIDSLEQGLLREEAKFQEIANLLQTTDIDQVSQVGNMIVQAGRNLGVLDVGQKGTNLARLKYLLKTIEVSETANILGEAGKTLSDVDRALVRDIVGQIDFANADEGLLKDKLREIYSLVITRGKNNINAARTALSEDFGVNASARQSTPAGMTQTGEDSEGRPRYKLD